MNTHIEIASLLRLCGSDPGTSHPYERVTSGLNLVADCASLFAQNNLLRCVGITRVIASCVLLTRDDYPLDVSLDTSPTLQALFHGARGLVECISPQYGSWFIIPDLVTTALRTHAWYIEQYKPAHH